MEPFITKKTINYIDDEISYQPAHTDFAMLKVEKSPKDEFQLKVSLEVTSTLSKNTGTTQILLTKEDQLALIKKLVDHL